MGRCLLARQPIVDRNQRLVAYELLFRSHGQQEAQVTNASQATADVIVNTLSAFGVDSILGNHKGFINLDLELLMDDSVAILPRGQMVIELLETIEPTPEFVERCRGLKEAGFTLALDDHEYHPRFDPLYQIADIVKVDLRAPSQYPLPDMVRHFRRYPMQLLAEKVETPAEFQTCLDLGFDLFQGYYFAKPAVMEKKRVDGSYTTLLKLMRLLDEDVDLPHLEEAFRTAPGLTYRLLLLVNSVGIGVRSKIETVRHALAILGRQQIKRWVQLSLFANSNAGSTENPLMDMAAVRAGIMEHLACCHHTLKGKENAAEKAFMTGILSVLEKVYDISMEEIVSTLNLSDDVSAALSSREGGLGELLEVTELLEQLEFGRLGSYLDRCGVTVNDLLASQQKAYAWQKSEA
jgi:EAL and modified HD-GYP domain-containing signal transduction protein